MYEYIVLSNNHKCTRIVQNILFAQTELESSDAGWSQVLITLIALPEQSTLQWLHMLRAGAKKSYPKCQINGNAQFKFRPCGNIRTFVRIFPHEILVSLLVREHLCFLKNRYDVRAFWWWSTHFSFTNFINDDFAYCNYFQVYLRTKTKNQNKCTVVQLLE